jgi:hypothetical protein
MADLPTVMTAAGLQPIAPVDLRSRLVALVAATNPDYTANLPGLLIEDIASTDVGALTQIDQMRVELINSLTPYGANEFILTQLGSVYGVPKEGASNASVLVQFTGSQGFVVSAGFTVSDGIHQYVVEAGSIVGSSATNVRAVASEEGTWSIPANTVNQLITSVPAGITLTVNNPLPGTPAADAPSATEYRTQVLRAGLAASQGMLRYLKTLLRNVAGVQERLISVPQKTPVSGGCGRCMVMVGGSGDVYQIATAIFNAVFDVSALAGSDIHVTGVTQANPGVVTTDIDHLLVEGQTIRITGILGMIALNNIDLTVAIIGPRSFSVGVNTLGYPAWASGGLVTPNARNVTVNIDDYPDSYQIPFVVPPLQNVRITATWNTSSLNFVGAAAIASLAAPALVSYINTIPAGKPIILYELENAFRNAIATILTPQQLTRMVFTVLINGIEVDALEGTGVIAGDPESYLFAASDAVTVIQG